MASAPSGPGSGPGGQRRAAVPRRPYLLRAMHEWISDSGYTPHVIVDALQSGVEVPAAYVKEGKIVLNLSTAATQRLQLKNDGVQFDARFAGIVHHVKVPIQAILGIYARETGEGMIFSESDPEGPTPPSGPGPGPETPPPETPERRRAKLTVVK
jgi:stringent starvation protein B